jgi:hypothetical protein
MNLAVFQKALQRVAVWKARELATLLRLVCDTAALRSLREAEGSTKHDGVTGVFRLCYGECYGLSN